MSEECGLFIKRKFYQLVNIIGGDAYMATVIQRLIYLYQVLLISKISDNKNLVLCLIVVRVVKSCVFVIFNS